MLYSFSLHASNGLMVRKTPAKLRPHKKPTNFSPGGASIPIIPVVTNPRILTIRKR